jgi:hypothetical protein
MWNSSSVIREHIMSKKKSFRKFIWRLFFVRGQFITGLLLLSLPGILLFFRFPGEDPKDAARQEVAADESAPILSLSCKGEEEGQSCMRGSTITFKLRPPEGRYFFSAFAKHRKSGATVWYFPATRTGKSLILKEDRGSDLVDIEVELNSEHAAGEYDVFGIYSRNPHDRDVIIGKVFDNQYDTATENPVVGEYTIVKTTLQVE